MKTINNFEFKALPYSYDALEPYIDKLTLEIHYGKHHKAYRNIIRCNHKGACLLFKISEQKTRLY